MPHGVGKSRLFAPQNCGREPVALEGAAEEVFALAVFVQLARGGRCSSHISQIPGRRRARAPPWSGRRCSGRRAARRTCAARACAFATLSEIPPRSGQSRCTYSRTVRRRSRPSAARARPYCDGWPCTKGTCPSRPDGGDVEGGKRRNDLFEGRKHLFPRHEYFGVFGADIVRDEARILKSMASFSMPMAKVRIGFLRARARWRRRGSCPARRKQKAEGSVAVQPLLNACDQPLADAAANSSKPSS